MTKLVFCLSFVGLLLAEGLAPVARADTTSELERKIEATQDSYDTALGEYNAALRAMTESRGELDAAESSVVRRAEEMEAALEELKKVQEFARDRTDVSDEREKEAYAAAKAAHDEAQRLLGEKTEQLDKAKTEAASILTTLKGYRSELENLNRQVATIRFRRLQESLSQESTVVARGELGCEDVTVRQCRDGALELAKRSAVEQASAVILDSATVMEDLRVFVDSDAVAEERQMMKDRIESHVSGILVSHEVLDKGWVGETGYFYEIEAVVKGQVSEEFFRIAGVEDLPVPPEPDEVVTRARADAESERAHAAPLVDDPEHEVLRLVEQIGTERDRIESQRTTELDRAEDAYRAGLAAIEPKDMFESEAEYHARDAREKSEAALERARATSAVHRKYDSLLVENVEPLVKRARALLGRDDIVPEAAIEFELATYDAEHEAFLGRVEIDHPLMKKTGRLSLPMKKTAARAFWKSRESLKGKVRLFLEVRSQEISMTGFWLADARTGQEARVTVIESATPPAGSPSSAEASKAQLELAKPARQSAFRLAGRAGEGVSHNSEARGLVAEYNRLIGEAGAVLVEDPFVRALKPLGFSGARQHTAAAVATAASGVAAYLSSFAPDKAFGEVASTLARRAGKGVSHTSEAKGLVAEYNRLIGEAGAVLVEDPFVRALKPLGFSGDRQHTAAAVATAASGVAAYLSSFAPDKAFGEVASTLARRAGKGVSHTSEARGLVAEYNRLIGEAGAVLVEDPFVRALKPLGFSGARQHTAVAVATAASGVAAYLSSFAPDKAFGEVASTLARRAGKGVSHTSEAKGLVAEYNRLIGEAGAVLVEDPFVRALKPLGFSGDRQHTAAAVATAAGKLVRVFAAVEVPARGEAVSIAETTKANTVDHTSLDYLAYSGRFSETALQLERRLGRRFSPYAKDENGWTDLHYAAALNLPGLASALLDAGANPHLRLKRDGEAFTADLKATLAAFGRNLDGDDLGDWARNGQMPLQFAAWFDAALAASHLIASGADVDVQSNEKRTPLYLAAWKDSRTVAELLIGRGANVRADSRNGWTPLDYALYRKAAGTAGLIRRHGGPCNQACQ